MSQRRRLDVLATLLVLTACSPAAPEPGAERGALHLAMIPKGTTHVFWKSVEAGARGAAAELGVELEWKGPLVEDDRAQQIQLVQQFVAQGVDGLLLAPLDRVALAAPIAQARARSIPVVIFDSALEGEPGADFASLVATDNRAAGVLAGAHLARLLANEPERTAVLLRYQVGSASTEEREVGFLEALTADGAVQVLVDNRYAGPTAGEAKTSALNMLDSLRAARGIFCSNESATMGMLLALRQEGLAGKVRFVGFDASPPLVAALDAGEIDALVVQNPRKMGDLAVRTMAAVLRGEPVEPRIDTGAVLVTRENRGEPTISALLE
jgi:ribose transport system substrate-binding protein